jgi:hypothetical protein
MKTDRELHNDSSRGRRTRAVGAATCTIAFGAAASVATWLWRSAPFDSSASASKRAALHATSAATTHIAGAPSGASPAPRASSAAESEPNALAELRRRLDVAAREMVDTAAGRVAQATSELAVDEESISRFAEAAQLSKPQRTALLGLYRRMAMHHRSLLATQRHELVPRLYRHFRTLVLSELTPEQASVFGKSGLLLSEVQHAGG